MYFTKVQLPRSLFSIHDVHEENFLQIEQGIRQLNDLGVEKIALMVTPMYHGRMEMSAPSPFVDWLLELQEKDIEIFVHGLFHLRIGNEYKGVRSVFGNILAGPEAELLNLSEEQKFERCKFALEKFFEVGVEPVGFVAPTWHGSPKPETIQSLALQFTESRFFVTDLLKNSCLFVPPVSFGQLWINSFITSWLCRPWWKLIAKFGAVRIVLHPPDLQRKFLQKRIKQFAQKSKPISYGELFS